MEDSASDEEGGEALSTAAYSGKKRGASAVDRGAISSSRGGGEDGKAAKMQRQRGTFGAEQAHQAELKIRRAKYARDFDGSHQGALAAEAERAKAKKKKRSRAGAARREKRERRKREMMLPKSRDPSFRLSCGSRRVSTRAEQSAARRLLHAEEAGVLEAEGEMEAPWRSSSPRSSLVNMLARGKSSTCLFESVRTTEWTTPKRRHLLIGGAKVTSP